MSERYEAYNEIIFDAYCKKSIDNAVKKERERKAARAQVELSLSALPESISRALSVPEPEVNDEEDFYMVETDDMTVPVRGKKLGQALASLMPQDREIVLRYYYKNERDRKIARIVGLPRATVQRRRERAIEKLRAMLERYR